MATRDVRRWLPWAALIAAVVVFPIIVQAPYARHLVILGMLFAVLASNWDLTLGYAGLFNFAHVAFFALGAYASAIVTISFGLSPWVGIPVAAVVAVLASLIAFLPAVRLRGIYLALTTFAFSQVCLWIVLSQSTYTGGAQGRVGIPPYSLGAYAFNQDGHIGDYVVASVLFVASTVFLRVIVTNRVGMSFVALKDDEDYAVSVGVSVVRQQALAFAASAVFTGMTGAVYAHYIGAISVGLFGFSYASLLLSMVWLGGVGTIFGPILGSMVLTVVSELLAQYGPWRFMLIAVLIVLTLRYLPSGLWGTASSLFRSRRQPGARMGTEDAGTTETGAPTRDGRPGLGSASEPPKAQSGPRAAGDGGSE